MSDPSVTVAEAFKQFSQVTVAALRAYEHGTRARLNQAEDDLRVLRHERDDSLRDLNACKEQARAWVADVNRWKAEADSALLVNKHQAELIAQLRQEAQQWKDQCLRLEETLRGEIKAWKDQFLRIDTEHTRLLHQLSTSSPQVRYLAAHDDDPLPIPTSSPRSKPQTTLTAHTPKRVPILAGGDSSTTSSARTVTKRYASASASSSTVRADKLLHPSPTKPALAFPRVVRRVQAVIAVPVKQEEEGDENRVDWPTDSAVQQQPPSTPTGTTSGAGTSSRGGRGSARRRKSSASSHQRSLAAPPPSNDGRRRSFAAHDDEEGGGEGDEEESPSDEDEDEEVDDGGEYVDEEEVEIAIASGTPATTGPRTMMVPWGRKHIGHEPDEEDDELMMYPKDMDTPQRVRPPHENHHQPPRVSRRKSIIDVTAQQQQQQRLSASTNAAAVPKRKTTETGSGGSARAKRRK